MIFKKNQLKIFYCLVATFCSMFAYAQTEHETQQVNQFLNTSQDVGLNAVPSFYSKENTQGFQYFSRRWLRAAIVYADNQAGKNNDTLKIDNSRFYNFDKFNNKLVSSEDGKNILTIPSEAVSKFILIDSGKAYVFKKVPEINKSVYFQPMLENEPGYSLYKLTITKYKRADYQNIGYGETGKKYDEYVDSYEYYIVFPGGRDFKKIALNTGSVKKALKPEAADVDEFFQKNPGDLTEEVLYNLIVFLNNKNGS